MLFSEPAFLFTFLPILLLLHACTPRRLRNALLLVASLFFYAWGERAFVFAMLASIIYNYALARAIRRAPTRARARLALGVAIAGNLLFLIAYKYADFLTANANAVLSLLSLPQFPLPHVHLPIGISFFTFQAMSCVIDVYRGDVEPQRNVVDFGLYIALFPQLIAGPIVRYRDMAAQLASRLITRQGFAEGIRRFVLGLAKKVILADGVALAVDRIFAIPHHQLTMATAWLGAVCYALQIYFDFSGYSDMAVGLGRMFGFELPENFNLPYMARSLTDFWRRWHISLSTWFRDYLYIPLGGNRLGAVRMHVNLITVFFLCGLWHGASWSFVAWGLYHGMFLLLERTMRSRGVPLQNGVLGHIYLLLVVLVGWVLFRCATLGDALAFFHAMVGLSPATGVERGVAMFLTPELVTVVGVGVLASTPLFAGLAARWSLFIKGVRAGHRPACHALVGSLAVLAHSAVFLYSLMLVAVNNYSPFLYFRF